MSTSLQIKNMVCPRCIEAVRNIFEKEGIAVESVELGKVITKDKLDEKCLEKIDKELEKAGFELLQDKNKKLVVEIKSQIISLVHHTENLPEHLNFSSELSNRLNKDYKQLSQTFSTLEGITIEKYIILQKIEKVKELLSYGELTLSEIAYRMGYSNVQYLSSQFRKVTGLSPTEYSRLQDKGRNSLDNIG